ncbi:MAG: hypothetical protein QXZ22_03460 [Sulfolobales archaeon]
MGHPRKDLEDAVSRLSTLGYIEIEREGNRKIMAYVIRIVQDCEESSTKVVSRVL